MSSTAVHSLTYLRPSGLERSGGRDLLGLQTSGGSTPGGAVANPTFFRGFVTRPEVAAGGLLAVADVAGARYYDPRQTRAASLDPVVTANGDRLRFESFSACCGVHARLDVLDNGIDGDIGYGTTNVDVNTPLRDALNGVGAGDPLHLTVGPDELAVATIGDRVVEKKVPLPDRWLRGFAETQVITAGFDVRAEVSATEAVRFLRGLPRSGTNASRGGQWVVAAGGRLRITSRPVPGAVCLPGPQRLGALQRVLRHADSLRIYGPQAAGDSPLLASAWEIGLPGMRLTLTLSPEAGRGFSGEGTVLDGLADADAESDAELLSVLLAWDPRIEIGELAERSGLTPERVRAALTRLGVDGRIGYDMAEAAYYHRELPYAAGRVERHNPRLKAARELVAADAVRLDARDPALADVVSGGYTHRVRSGSDGTFVCTCDWWAETRGNRGPCRHALAVRIVRRATPVLL
ncbi:winged helix-turn-helix transcriptional regulator [Nocardia yamanashiensis]|uniref:winged helix-turn-helix transcriptional regulator n=1 Tax=Nocardia yamanashiensis TaxID=209247 RepID=UPI001E540819|nr:SWIM zinc finger family protein [Nocardia yamanashiensis]UGT38910.1 winged helix-turn-helix transcriptional regulator [Nocardia yamanashiensis]